MSIIEIHNEEFTIGMKFPNSYDLGRNKTQNISVI